MLVKIYIPDFQDKKFMLEVSNSYKEVLKTVNPKTYYETNELIDEFKEFLVSAVFKLKYLQHTETCITGFMVDDLFASILEKTMIANDIQIQLSSIESILYSGSLRKIVRLWRTFFI